jgi:DNA primase
MSMIVNILENFLGTPASHYEGKSQVQFDCPMCSEEKGEYNGDGKGNLAINYEKGVYKCWNCWERNNMHGSVLWLIKKYGNKQHYRDYLLIAPTIIRNKLKKDIEIVIDVKLPESYRKFSESTPYHTNHSDAYEYVKNRGLTDETLKRFNIGYTCDGKRKDRIIIPSYDVNGDLNYYIARSWHKWNKAKYLNPEADVDAKNKSKIIFNEHKINWDSNVYLVEGAFDHIVTPNSIPLLGKFISDTLFNTLQSKCKCGVIIVLDGGAEERRDTKLLFKKLNTLNLYNRVKVVEIKNGTDLSLLNQEGGTKRVLKSLRASFAYKESRL